MGPSSVFGVVRQEQMDAIYDDRYHFLINNNIVIRVFKILTFRFKNFQSKTRISLVFGIFIASFIDAIGAVQVDNIYCRR